MLTQLQAMDEFILDSVVQFIGRNVKPHYDSYVSSISGYAGPLKVMVGEPDDPSTVLYTPTVAVNTLEATEKDSFYGIGAMEKAFRHQSFVFYCYPAVDSVGNPSLQASLALSSFMKNAMGTECIKIVDYANSTPSNIVFCEDVMDILRRTDPMPRGTKDSLANERHRFDIHVSVRYPVTESLAT